MTPWRRLLLVTAVCFLGAKVGYFTEVALGHRLALLWPDTGLAVAFLFWFGNSAAWGVFLGVLVAALTDQGYQLIDPIIAVLETAECLTCVWLLRSILGFDVRLQKTRDTIALIAATLIAPPLCGALFSLIICGLGLWPWSGFPFAWQAWWIPDTVSILLLTPALLTFTRIPFRAFRKNSSQLAEALLLVLGITAVSWVEFFHTSGHQGLDEATYILPLLIWVAIRFGQASALSTIFYTTLLAIIGTLRASPNLQNQVGASRILDLQIYLALIGGTILILATVLKERSLLAEEREKAVRHEEHRFREIANAVPQLVWTSKPSGHIDFLNQRIQQFETLDGPIELDQILREIIHPDELTAVTRRWRDCIAEGNPFEMECRLKLRANDYHWFLARALPIREDGGEESGKIRKWFGTATDIQNQKIALEQLEQEKQIRERFVSALSHDLRNPLAAATAASQLLAKFPENTQLRERALRQLRTSLERSARMLQGLLDANRLRAGEKLPLAITQCNLDLIAREVIAELTEIHGEHFVLQSSGDILGFWSSDDLKRVIENLCNNAVKYGDLRQPVTIAIHRLENERVSLSVHNHGKPLTPQEREHLFQPFHRTASALRSGKQGWGIGLMLVKGIAEAHGGEVSVTSGPEEGTRFQLILPADARRSATLSAA